MLEKEKTFNPTPLGLFGFGMATILLNLMNLNLIPLTNVVIGAGIFLGGFLQVLTGIILFKNKDSYGGTIFTIYGTFWFSTVFIWSHYDPFLIGVNPISLGFYTLIWLLLSIVFFITSFKHSLLSRLIFGMLSTSLIFLAIYNFSESEIFKIISGVFGLLVGLAAFYDASRLLINDQFQKKILP